MSKRTNDIGNAVHPEAGGGFVALVVDDDTTTRLMARVVLEAANFVVVEATDGAAALAEFDRRRPDIVLLDVVMPGMDGYETCIAMRERPGGRHLPILVMTGLDDSRSVDQAYLAGATDFVAKPIAWPVLVQRMRYMLRASRAFMEVERSRAELAARVAESQASAQRISTLLKLFEMGASATESALLAYGLEQAERLTGSRLACVHLLDDGTQTVCLTQWASSAEGGWDVARRDRYPLHAADPVFACAASGRPSMLNDCGFRLQLPERDEATPVSRLLTVPVVEDGHIRMMLGVANKDRPYDAFDAETVHLIGNDLWRIVRRARDEAKLRTLSRVVEQSPVSIVITDREGAIEYVNPAFAAVSGYAASEVRGRTPSILKSGLMPLSLYEQIWATITQGGEWRGELCNRSKAGALYWEQASISGLVDDNGQIVQFFAVKQDITERKRMEAEIRALNEGLEQRIAERTAELERANRELDAFCYSISHDLRAPLRAVSGFSEILWRNESSLLTPQGRDLLTRMLNNCRRMGQMIDDLLRLSRLGRGELERKPVDLKAVVADVLRTLQADYPGTEVAVAPLPRVTCDPGLISQVFQNLLANAFKYSARRQAPRVSVTVEALSPDTVVCIRDNGVGFDMKYAGRLFTAFQRLHAQSDFPGTGIGLALVARIVARHGGRVWAHSAPDQGAAFYFTLPGTAAAAVETDADGVRTPAGEAV